MKDMNEWRSNRLHPVVTGVTERMLPASAAAVMWIQFVVMLLSAVIVHLQSAITGLTAAFTVSAAGAPAAWFLALRRPVPRPGRFILVALLVVAPVSMAVLAVTWYGLAYCPGGMAVSEPDHVHSPSPRAPRLAAPSPDSARHIAVLAVLYGAMAIASILREDDTDAIVHRLKVDPAALIEGKPVTFPGHGVFELPRRFGPGLLMRIDGRELPSSEGGGRFLSADRYVTIDFVTDEKFTIDGWNVHTSVTVTPREALRGCRLELDTFDGRIALDLPPMALSHRKLRLKNLGLPRPGGGRGKMMVHVRVTQSRDWRPKRTNGMVVVDVRSLTTDGFEELLACSGWDRLLTNDTGPLVYVFAYAGVEVPALPGMREIVEKLNRSTAGRVSTSSGETAKGRSVDEPSRSSDEGRAVCPVMQVALYDRRTGETFFPHGLTKLQLVHTVQKPGDINPST